MFQNFDLGVFLLAVLPVLLSITVREVARGYTARYWGDNTAEQYGRLTLNPLPHIDLVGTIIVPLLTLMFTPSCSAGRVRFLSIRATSATRALPGVALPRPARCRIWRWLFCGAWFWC